jgi:hypothetical protein
MAFSQNAKNAISTAIADRSAATELMLCPQGVATGYKIARGQHTTASASDTIVTGLATVVSIVVSLDADPIDACQFVTSSFGDQIASPVAGSAYIKTWKATAAGNTALTAATTFSKKVNWIAIGT